MPTAARRMLHNWRYLCEISAVSPVYMMFAVIAAGAAAMLGFYGKQECGTRLDAIFNIFR